MANARKEPYPMGIYVNPGNTAFEMSCHSNIYVDKTMLISRTNNLYRSEQRFLCVSRPAGLKPFWIIYSA